jgi:hypothetical protein
MHAQKQASKNVSDDVRKAVAKVKEISKEEREKHLVNITLKADPIDADRTWQHFNHVITPIKLPDEQGYHTRLSGYKAWFDFNKGEASNDAFRTLLQSKSVFYPFEEITRQLKEIVQGKLKSYELKLGQFRYSRHEQSGYCEVVSQKKFHIVPDSHIKDDRVYFGAVIRNGIGVNVALGADLYTFREICSNGATVRSQKLGSIAIHHLGSAENMATRFATGIEEIFESVKKLMDYYDEMAKIKLTQEMLEKVYIKTKLPEAYMPRYVEMEKNEKAIHKHKVHLHEQKVPLWKFYNDITKPMNKNLNAPQPKIGYQRFEQKTTALTLAMVEIVNQNRRKH